jgi:N-acetylgalactosamine PTS system EIIB component
VRDLGGLARARAAGLTPALAPKVNLGNVHFGPGRRQVTPSVFLSDDDLRAVREVVAAGFEVEARAIPSEPPAGMDEIERRYAAAR